MKQGFLRAVYIWMTVVFCLASGSAAYAEEGPETGLLKAGAELHAFYPAYKTYSPEMEKYIDRADSISFAWGRLYYNELDAVNVTKGQNGNTSFYYPEDFAKPVGFAKEKGKPVQISVFSDAYNAERILPYIENRSMAISSIVTLANHEIIEGESLYYDGVVIDFEGLRNTDRSGHDMLFEGKYISDWFNLFLEELNAELDKNDKKLYVAVNPKIYFDGFDYGMIAKIADKMIIMAHDYEPTMALKKSEVLQYTGYNALYPIDSLAPIHKIKQALEDVKYSVESSEMHKVWLQLSFDSAQWKYKIPEGKEWESLDSQVTSDGARVAPTYQMIKNRIDNKDMAGKNIRYDYNYELQCPTIQYFNAVDKTHNIIIFEDSTSIKAKIDMVKSYGLGGISIWSIGNIPDFNDPKGKQFHLNVWENLLSSLISSKPAAQNVKVRFTDKGIEKAVRLRLDKPTGEIYKNEVEKVYRLRLSDGVKSLSDLKYLPNLEYLDAQNIGISNISALSTLSNIRVLYLQRNKISDLTPLKNLKKLQILSLNGNQITRLDALYGLVELKELYVRENRITSVNPLAKLVNLRKLYLCMNQIADVSGLANLTGLNELSIDRNKVSNLKPLGKLNKIIYLNAGGNRISDISTLKLLKKTEVLYLQRNIIKDINVLGSLTSLRELSLNGNLIVDITPLGKLTQLQKLYIKDNKITKVSKLKNLGNLTTFYLGGNKITDLNFIKKSYGKLVEGDFKEGFKP